jgi:hypothetical protein
MVDRFMKRLAIAASVAALVLTLAASAALAGEVKGPPGSPEHPPTNYNTAATSHANSACVFSGLNDYINGQTDRMTQTPKDGPPGAPGHGVEGFSDGCRGGSNPDNPPS